jgi:hypothetical protein
MVGMRRRALATRTCSRATPGVMEQDHDSQCANDLNPVQCRNPPSASNSPNNSTNTNWQRAASAAAAQILPANASASTRSSS